MTTDRTRIATDLITCTRLLVHQGILDYSGHVSARIPGTDHLLIQTRKQSRATVTAEDLLLVDLDGEVVEGEGMPPAETAIHTGVYRSRPDVFTVCHGHPGASVAFSVVDVPLLPVRHFFFEYPTGVPVHEDATHIRTREQGDAVAQTLGTGGACLLRSHGTVVAAADMEELFMDCLDLEENARTLMKALQLGTLRPLSEQEIDDVRASYAKNGFRAAKTWAHHQELGRNAGVL